MTAPVQTAAAHDATAVRAVGRTWPLAILLAGLASLGPFTIDAYLPSFPAIGADLGVGPAQMQQTLSAFMAAFAAMSLFHGALSDAFGRRPIILGALGVYALACLGAAFATSFEALLAFRVLQGLSGGAGYVVGRAIVRDRFEGHVAQSLLSQVMLFFAIAPAIAPMIGGWLHVSFGWRSVFLFLVALGLVLLAATWGTLRETLPPQERQPFHPRGLARSYATVLRNGRFVALAAGFALTFGGLGVYIATAHDFVLSTLGLTETDFGWLFVPIVVGSMLGSSFVTRWSARIAPQRLVVLGLSIAATAAAANLAIHALGVRTVLPAVLPLGLYAIGTAILMPVLSIRAIDLVPAHRGLASSLLAFVQTGLFALVAGLIGPLVLGSGLRQAAAMAALFLVGIALLGLSSRRKVPA